MIEVIDVNLRPKGLVSLKDFLSEKRPENNVEKYTCILYWFRRVARLEGVGLSHIYTALKHIGQKPPASLRERLKDVKVRQRWIETKDGSNLEMKQTGVDFVEHDLPRKRAE